MLRSQFIKIVAIVAVLLNTLVPVSSAQTTPSATQNATSSANAIRNADIPALQNNSAADVRSFVLNDILKRDEIPEIAEAQRLKERLARFREFHFPVIDGKKVLPIPYLSLPFREADLNGQYNITEGWVYSDTETSIHGFVNHNGIDLTVPFGTPVYSPVDGYAMSTYQTFWIRNDDGTIRTYKGIPLRFGLGNFIQIYVPSVDRFIQMAHLSYVDPAIPFSPPIANGDDWVPVNHNLKLQDFINSPKVVKVKKGQLLGRVGYSGLAWGYEDYHAGADRPVQIDPTTQKSWDEPHVHFEDFYRDQTTGIKIANRDPYGIYSTTEDYPTPSREGVDMLAPLFLLGAQGLPQFTE